MTLRDINNFMRITCDPLYLINLGSLDISRIRLRLNDACRAMLLLIDLADNPLEATLLVNISRYLLYISCVWGSRSSQTLIINGVPLEMKSRSLKWNI